MRRLGLVALEPEPLSSLLLLEDTMRVDDMERIMASAALAQYRKCECYVPVSEHTRAMVCQRPATYADEFALLACDGHADHMVKSGAKELPVASQVRWLERKSRGVP